LATVDLGISEGGVDFVVELVDDDGRPSKNASTIATAPAVPRKIERRRREPFTAQVMDAITAACMAGHFTSANSRI
jgi:hypothetical protein